jgi:hypothetical protein
MTTNVPTVHDDNGFPLMDFIKSRMIEAGFVIGKYGCKNRGVIRNMDGMVGFAINLDEVPIYGKPNESEQAAIKRAFKSYKKSGGDMWLTNAADPNKMVFHVSFKGRSAGIVYKTNGDEWEMTDTKPAEVKFTRLFESLGFKVYLAVPNGWANETGDDEVHYKIVTDRPAPIF